MGLSSFLKLEDEEEKGKYRDWFLDYIRKDFGPNVFSLWNFLHEPSTTETWVQLKDDEEVVGYVQKHFSERWERIFFTMNGMVSEDLFLKTVGEKESLYFSVDPEHLPMVTRIFEPRGSPFYPYAGDIACFLVMNISKDRFKRCLREKEAVRLSLEDIEKQDMLEECEIFLKHGWGFGVFRANRLVSWAFGWDFLEDFAVVRDVSTLEEFRGKGYGTIVSSAVVSFAFDVMEKPCVFLWVEESNIPAKKIYEKLGFEVAGKRMSFDGRRILPLSSEKQ
ncbi:MAG: GNAT family N-acetyltransferase [Candidatus Hodarchaeota archaeon]